MARITEEDQLRLENKALRTLIGRVSSFSADDRPDTRKRLQEIVDKAREILIEIGKRKKGPKPEDTLEQVSQYIRNNCSHMGIEKAVIIVERLDAWDYEAFVDGQDENIGVGVGETAVAAVQGLYDLLKAYKQSAKLRT